MRPKLGELPEPSLLEQGPSPQGRAPRANSVALRLQTGTRLSVSSPPVQVSFHCADQADGKKWLLARREVLQGRIDSDTESPRGGLCGAAQLLPGSTRLMEAVSDPGPAKGSTCVGEGRGAWWGLGLDVQIRKAG